MTAEWMLYALAAAMLVGLGALALERALQLFSLPQRWAWVAAIATSLLLPLAGSTLASLVGDAPEAAPAEFPVMEATVPLVAPLPPAAANGSDPMVWLERVLVGGWLLASLAVAGWLALSAISLRRVRRRWRRASVEGSEVLVSKRTGPAVVGCFRGEVVLPEWVMEWDAERRRLIVAHEREHLRARDPLLLMGGWVALAVTPWNPALWWQVHRLRQAVEVDCDRRVLLHSPDVRRYGSLLLEVGRRGGTGWMPAAAFSEPANTLERRIRMITWKRPRNRARQAAAALAAAALVPVALYAIPPAERPPLARLSELVPSRLLSGGTAAATAPQESAVLWITSGNEFRVGSPDAPALREDQLDASLSALRRRVGDAAMLVVRSDTANVDRPGMGYSAVMAGQVACRAGFDEVTYELVKRVPQTGEFRSIGSRKQRLAPPCGGPGAREAARAKASRGTRVIPTSGDTTPVYEVAQLERKPELVNRSEVAQLLQRSYPPMLEDAGIGGQTMVKFVIGADGRVEPASVSVVSTANEQLGEATINVVRQMTFRAGMVGGRAVRTVLQMPVTWQPRGGTPRQGTTDFRGLGGAPRQAPAAPGSAYEVAQLDVKPELANRSEVASLLQRLYPRMLQDAGISGQTTVQFVIQPDGAIDPASVKVVATSHEQFGEASIKVVERMKFRPGQVSGVSVPTLLQMPITWVPASAPMSGAPEAANEVRVGAHRPGQSRPAGGGSVADAGAPLPNPVITGSVKDASGRSVAGATVVVPAIARGTVTNEEGRFRLMVGPGTHSVQILAPGRQSPIIRSVTVPSDALRPSVVDVTLPSQ